MQYVALQVDFDQSKTIKDEAWFLVFIAVLSYSCSWGCCMVFSKWQRDIYWCSEMGKWLKSNNRM